MENTFMWIGIVTVCWLLAKFGVSGNFDNVPEEGQVAPSRRRRTFSSKGIKL